MIAKSCTSQTTYPALTVLDGDTVICLKPLQLKTLNSQIALLIEYHTSCTATVRKADELLETYRKNETDLRLIITNSNGVIEKQNKQIDNLKSINKNTKKIWLRRLIGGTGGGVIVGVIAGILIVK